MENKDFIKTLYQSHKAARNIISPTAVCKLIDQLIKLLFPAFADKQYRSLGAFKLEYDSFRVDLVHLLEALEDIMPNTAEDVEKAFMDDLPSIWKGLDDDAEAILAGDPAATTKVEVIRTYPGFYAIAIFRIAHALYQLEVPLIPRILTEHAHGKTGIDIHPAAKIGKGFCIDHGTGVVIGETVDIGDHVKIYQGVTLGALSVSKEMAQTKRHPTIEDNVVIYAGATILGGQTTIGHNSVIGGNVWITKTVPPFSRIYYQGSHIEKIKPSSVDQNLQEGHS